MRKPARKVGMLLEQLGADQHPLAAALETWLGDRRFAAFVREHVPKIRKKLRGAQDLEAARDLLLELAAAHHLTLDKRHTVTYEPTSNAGTRGPDFAVRFTTRSEFMLEVTRLRGSPTPEATAEPNLLDARRLAAVLALKLGQTVAGAANVLLIGSDEEPPPSDALAAMMRELRHDAETTDPESLLRKGFRHRGEYLRRLAHLSAVVVRRAPTPEAFELSPDATIWLNPLASTPLPNELRAALLSEQLRNVVDDAHLG